MFVLKSVLKCLNMFPGRQTLLVVNIYLLTQVFWMAISTKILRYATSGLVNMSLYLFKKERRGKEREGYRGETEAESTQKEKKGR